MVDNQLSTFWLVLGYACNNRCKDCYALPCDFDAVWMDVGYAKEVMRTMKEGGAKTCLLIGGEPTLHPHSDKIISFGAELGLVVVIVSNGRRFKNTDYVKKVFDNGLDRAVISINGKDAITHNSLTNSPQSFQETISGIENCSEIGKASSLTTICKINATQVIDIIKLSYRKLSSQMRQFLL